MRKSAMKLTCIKLDLQNDAATIWGSKFCWTVHQHVVYFSTIQKYSRNLKLLKIHHDLI